VAVHETAEHLARAHAVGPPIRLARGRCAGLPRPFQSADGPYNQAADQPASAFNAIDAATPYTLSRLKKQGGETPYDFSR